MNVVFYVVTVSTMKLKASYVVEASRPSTAAARAIRIFEDSGVGVPRTRGQTRLIPWGAVEIYRVPPEMVPSLIGARLNRHAWEKRGRAWHKDGVVE